MAGTGYDEKQSGQLLLLEHHYKPFFGQRFCTRQRESILYRQNKSWVIFTCTKKKPQPILPIRPRKHQKTEENLATVIITNLFLTFKTFVDSRIQLGKK